MELRAGISQAAIEQWGSSNETNVNTTVTYPVAFSVLYSVVAVPKSSSNLSGSNSNFGVKSQNNISFIANMYDNSHGYAGFNWCAFGKVQALLRDSHQKPAPTDVAAAGSELSAYWGMIGC